MYHIRLATPDDAEALLRIYSYYVENTCISYELESPTVEEFRHRIEEVLKHYPYLVAESDDPNPSPLTARSALPLGSSKNFQFSIFNLKTWGLLFDQEDRERIIEDNGIVMTCRHYFTLPWDPRATDGTTWPEGGAMLIRLGKFDYLLAGSGVVIDFKTPTEKQQEQQKTLGEDGFAEAGGNTGQKTNKRFAGKRLGLLSVDEVIITDDGTMQYLRRHNGDQTHQGRHARIGVGEWKLLHIKLYEY